MALQVALWHCNFKRIISLKAKSDCYNFLKFYIYSSLVLSCEPWYVIIMELLRQQFANVLEALSNHMEWCCNQIHNVLSFSDKVIIKGVLAWTEKKIRAQTCSNVVSCDTNWAVPVLPFFSVFPIGLPKKSFWLCFILSSETKELYKGKTVERVKIQSEELVVSPPPLFPLTQLLAGIIESKSTDWRFSVKSIKYCFKKMDLSALSVHYSIMVCPQSWKWDKGSHKANHICS